jgi:hypothetical protein
MPNAIRPDSEPPRSYLSANSIAESKRQGCVRGLLLPTSWWISQRYDKKPRNKKQDKKSRIILRKRTYANRSLRAQYAAEETPPTEKIPMPVVETGMQ